MNALNISQWKKELEQILNSPGDREPIDLYKDVCGLGETMGVTTAEELLDTHPGLFKYSPILTQAHSQRIVADEIAETQRLLEHVGDIAVSFKNVASAAGLPHYDRVADLFNHVDFSNCHRFVSVGCGRLPSTNFQIHDNTEVPEIIGIDILPEAIDVASKLATKLGFPRIRMELEDGRRYDYGQAQIVFVANIVAPKSDVLCQIADTATEDVQIILREPFSLGRLWAESGERVIDPRLEVIGRGSGSWNLSRNVYLRKR